MTTSDDHIRTAENIVEEDVDETQTRAELLDLVEKMQQDWVTLNEFLNRTAIYYSWCSDWEDRIYQYNSDFRVLKLQGRKSHQRGHSEDNYLLPSLKLKSLAAQDQSEEARRECEVAELYKLQEREHELVERESRLRERERDLEAKLYAFRRAVRMSQREPEPKSPTIIRGSIREARFARYDDGHLVITNEDDEPPW